MMMMMVADAANRSITKWSRSYRSIGWIGLLRWRYRLWVWRRPTTSVWRIILYV